MRTADVEDAGPGGVLRKRSFVPAVVRMDVTVELIGRVPLVEEQVETVEAAVRKVRQVSVPPRRHMGQKDVDPSSPQFPFGGPEAFLHLLLIILVGAAAVPAATPEAVKTQAMERLKAVFDTDAPFGRPLFVDAVVVAANIKQRAVAHCYEILQIIGVQIPAGQDEVEVLQELSPARVPLMHIFFVCDC